MPTLNFNANNVAPSAGFEAVPAGKYQAVITMSDMKPTRTGTGKYLELTFEVIEGEYQGRKLWARLNLENQNQKAVAIAQGELSAICHAVDMLDLQESEQLHDLPLTISVKCVKNPETGEMTNEIKSYAAPENATPARKAQTSPQPGNANGPWAR